MFKLFYLTLFFAHMKRHWRRDTFKSAQQALEFLLLYVIEEWIIVRASWHYGLKPKIKWNKKLQLGELGPSMTFKLKRWRHIHDACKQFHKRCFYGHQNSLSGCFQRFFWKCERLNGFQKINFLMLMMLSDESIIFLYASSSAYSH